jgi:hypothetical protein
MVTTARRLDDDWDDTLYDRAYYPKKVFKDGKGVRVRLALTDGPPAWASRPRPAAVFDAAAHRPRYAVIDKADPVVRDAEAAYREGVRRLEDAWKTMPGGAGGEPLTTAPGASGGDDDDSDLSPRDRYIAGLQNAYKTPMGQAPAASADNIERARQQWISPGAKPGGGFGDARFSRETKDAATARDEAYAGYLDRLVNGWRT